MNLTLVYFDLPFWRAEVARLALYLGDIEFEDLRITREEFQRVKKHGKLDNGTHIPFHQFPVLIIDGASIAQTGGIGRFCGKLSGLYSRNDDLLAAKIDQFLDMATDLTFLISTTTRIEDPEVKRKMRKDLLDGELSRKLSMLETNINSNSNWVLETKVGITIADIAIWRLMGWFSGGMLEGMPTTLLKDFPKIRRVCQSVDSHPKVQKWVRKTYPENYQRGNF